MTMKLEVTGENLIVATEPLPPGVTDAGGAIFGKVVAWDEEHWGKSENDDTVVARAKSGARVLVNPDEAWQMPGQNDGIVRYICPVSAVLAYYTDEARRVAERPAQGENPDEPRPVSAPRELEGGAQGRLGEASTEAEAGDQGNPELEG